MFSKHSIMPAIASLLIANGCAKKKSSNPDTTVPIVPTVTIVPSGTLVIPMTGNTYNISGKTTSHMQQSFNANTPQGLLHLSTSSLNFRDTADICLQQFPNNHQKVVACNTMYEIQFRFFQPAQPGTITELLGNLDGFINMYANMPGYVFPCLDVKNATGGSFEINSISTTFPAFEMLKIPIKYIFAEGSELDSGLELNVSCHDYGTKGFDRAIGFNNGIWSAYEKQSPPIGTSGIFGTIDQNDIIRLWSNLGGSSVTATGAIEVAPITSVYSGGSGITEVISNPKLGLVGLSMAGFGIGPGCGAQLAMNSTTLYFVGNVNQYGSCTATDFNVSERGYEADLDNVQVCMDVSGSTVTPTPDLTACYASGLINLDDDGNTVTPFSTLGLHFLTADLNSTVAGAVKVRAWMTGPFMSTTSLSAVPDLVFVPLLASDILTNSGVNTNSLQFTRTTLAAKQSTSVTAPCSATGSALQTDLNETFSLSADVFAKEEQTIHGSSTTAANAVEYVNTSFANTGDTQAYIELPISGGKGNTFTGTTTGTFTVALDGKTIGTAEINLPTTDGSMTQVAKVLIPNATTITESSTFTITATGTLVLTCQNAVNLTRTVAVKPGLPRLIYFEKPLKI